MRVLTTPALLFSCLLWGATASAQADDVWPDDTIPPDDEPAAAPGDAAVSDAIPPDDEAPSAPRIKADDDDDGLVLEWGVRLQSDLRVRMEEKSVGAWYDRRTLPVGFARNENLIGLRLDARYGKVRGVADLDFVLYGFSRDVETLSDLSRREELDPYRFEAHNLYVQIKDLVFDGFDLTVGQQLVLWGVGDQFNPTNNLNADDIEDVLLFGEQQGNFMVKADYWIDENWSITGVIVPVFRPALLPRSGELQVARVDRLPFADQRLRARVYSEQAAANVLAGHPTVVGNVFPVLPDTALDNTQIGYRIGGSIGGQDISLSYYNGRTDFPVPFANHTVQNTTAACNPDDASDCIQGKLETNVFLHYPRMQVYGFNMAGEIPFLGNLGYRIEAALIAPEPATLKLTNDELNLGIVVQPAGEYDYDDDDRPGGPEPAIIESTPFAKWTIGLDYTFNKYIYANVQWVHGLADEYGAGDWINEGDSVREGGVISDDTTTIGCALTRDGTACAREIVRPRLGDYLVTGVDVRLLDQKLLLRLFTIFDLVGVDFIEQGERTHFTMFTEEGFGMVLYPEVGYNFGNGLELGAGALFNFGPDYGKFASAEAGGHVTWTRVRFSF